VNAIDASPRGEFPIDLNWNALKPSSAANRATFFFGDVSEKVVHVCIDDASRLGIEGSRERTRCDLPRARSE
jgi:hypothetical protein